ncbi:type 1 glutamine amidotransferase [Streptomyces sp. NPDC055663]
MPNDNLTIAWVYPDLLSTYGDQGNVAVLAGRARSRGIPVEILQIRSGRSIPASADIYMLGGGEDRAQELASDRLRADPGLRRAADAGRVIMGVCAGYQLLGTRFLGHDGRTHAGAGILDARSHRLEQRATGELLGEVDPELNLPEITGFENHHGSTALGPGARPLARTIVGYGNGDGSEGAYQGSVLATYMHGPALARNPALADLLLTWATGSTLSSIDDTWMEKMRDERLHHLGYSRSGRQTELSG